MKTSLLIVVTLLAAVARVPGAAVGPQGGFHRFSKEGLAFDYPVAWKLTESSSAELQRVLLTREGASNIIMVFAQREPLKNVSQLNAARSGITMPYVEGIARKLGMSQPPAPDDTQCVAVGERSGVGFRMTGQLEQQPTTAEVYTVVLGQRLLHLVHVRSDKDEAEGAGAWKTLLDTLKVDPPATPSPEFADVDDILSGGVLNGKAIKKAQPEYPGNAKLARASGTVTVQIIVDEKGDVVSAQAVSGHPSLREASEKAARRSKFTPTTLCGRPVKVRGVITFNFVLM